MFRKLRFDFRCIIRLRSWSCFTICSFGFYLSFFFSPCNYPASRRFS